LLSKIRLTATRICLNFSNSLGGPLIPDDVIAEVRRRTDIVALVGEHVKLKRTGASYVGICPFHPDKSPSFNVHGGRQFYHCFGCNVSGDAISFVMQLENISFMEAVRILAKRANIELPETDFVQEASGKRERAHHERLYALSEIAADFYHEQLISHPEAKKAHQELKNRKILRETAEKFRLGYAPDSWDELARFLGKKGLSFAEAEEIGLLIPRKSSSGYYDRFRNRLMFPVYDTNGHVVAFSGRILESSSGESPKQEAKYINSPESPLYKKGSILFGLYQNRSEIRKNGWAVLCEGNFDLLALYQAGVLNAVAPLGTAFTQEHAQLIRRFAQRLTVLFDGDAAGRKAVRAIYPFLVNAGLSARVITLPPEDDPDSFLRKNGSEALNRLIQNSEGIVETLIDQEAELALRQAADSASAIQKLGPLIAGVESPVERHKYIERVAQRFEINNIDLVIRELRLGARNAKTGEKSAPKRAIEVKSSVPTKEKRVNLPELQSYLVGLLLDFPELFEDPLTEKLEELLTSEQLRFIFQSATNQVRTSRDLSAPNLLTELEERFGKTSVYLWLQERLSVQKYDSAMNAREELQKGIPQLIKQDIERKLRSLTREYQLAKSSGDEKRASELMKQKNELWRSVPNR
jgi:DNA primase